MKFNLDKKCATLARYVYMCMLRKFWGGGGAHLCRVSLLGFVAKVNCSVLINSPYVTTTPDFSAVLGHYSVPSLRGTVLHPVLGHCPAPILGHCPAHSLGAVLHPVSGHWSASSIRALFCIQSWGTVLHPVLGQFCIWSWGTALHPVLGPVLHPVSGHSSASSLGALFSTQSWGTVLHPVLGHHSAPSLGALSCTQSWGTILHPTPHSPLWQQRQWATSAACCALHAAVAGRAGTATQPSVSGPEAGGSGCHTPSWTWQKGEKLFISTYMLTW